MTATLLRLPLGFEANQGQAAPGVKFLARGQGYSLFLTNTEAVLALPAAEGPAAGRRSSPMRLGLVGATASRVEGEERLAGSVNYFIGNDPAEWRTGIPTYARVRYRDVYPGVDLVYHGAQGELEFDLVVAPGADPGRVRLSVSGPGRLRLDGRGDLVLAADGREIRLRKPVVYQEVAGGRGEVAGRYVLAGRNEVRFAVDAYDARLALVIDPVIVYSSYLGGTANDDAADMGVDAAGNIYVAGTTRSLDYPLMNPLQSPKPNGSRSIFISKLNPAGSALLYSTYLGGSGDDPCFRMAVDSAGNVYVTGLTTSGNFPTMNAFQSSNAGGSDIYLSKVNPAGNALLYSTFLGGTGFDNTQAVGVNDAGDAVVAGMTTSTNFPLKNPSQSAPGGAIDAFVAKFDTNRAGAASLTYSTYFGGSGNEMGSGLVVSGAAALDGAGNAYVTGPTNSTNLPVVNAFQPSLGGNTDVFVARFNPAGAKVYATYLGGNDFETSFGITADSAGSAYIAGQTFSTNFPLKNPVQASRGPNETSFVTKLDAGGALGYSTYLGGNGGEAALRIVVDQFGSAYVTGGTASTDFPLVNPVQGAYGGGTGDVWVAQLSAAGNTLLFSSYLGGFAADTGVGIAVRGDGDIYVAAVTDSTNFPVVAPFQATLRGGTDTAIAKIGAPPSLVASILPISRSIQTPGPATVFATMINTGTDTATGCRVAQVTPVPTTFLFQTTDSSTNALTGTANQPVNISPGGVQSFLLALTSNNAFGPTNVVLDFGCSNRASALAITGLDTLLMSASSSPVPDVIAIGLTPSGDGIVNIPGTSGTGFFAVASSNVGAGGSITVSADTGGTTLPVDITLCQTDPANARCLAPPAATVMTAMNQGQNSTFSVFVRGTGNVPFNPALNRVVVHFRDGNGIDRGATGAALRTQ